MFKKKKIIVVYASNEWHILKRRTMTVAFQRMFGILERWNHKQVTPSLSKPHELSYRSNILKLYLTLFFFNFIYQKYSHLWISYAYRCLQLNSLVWSWMGIIFVLFCLITIFKLFSNYFQTIYEKNYLDFWMSYPWWYIQINSLLTSWMEIAWFRPLTLFLNHFA